MSRIGILATHPIQNHVPWFRGLEKRRPGSVVVLYGSLPDAVEQGVGFGVPFKWDVDLLGGYRWRCLGDTEASKSSLRDGKWICRARNAIEQEGIEALVVTGWHSKVLIGGILAARILRIPCLARGDSHLLAPRAWYRKAALRGLVGSFEAILAVGRSNRDFYLANGVPSTAIFPCPHLVDGVRLREQAARDGPRRMEIRREWGIEEDAVCVLFVGKLLSIKRVSDLIGALGRVARSGPRMHLIVVGEGPERDRLEGECREKRFGYSFTGFLNQSEVTRAYVAADILVLPSASESWGLVVNEAMSCGIPCVVSSGVGAGPDLVEAGVTGWVYPVGDVAALADALRVMAQDAEGRRRMGTAAEERIAAYSVEAAVSGTFAAVDYVLGGVSAGAPISPRRADA